MSKILDEFLRGVGETVADIRHKLIEEPWFGREVTPSAEQTHEPQAHRPDLMESFFEGREVTREELGFPAPEQTPDLGHDR